MKKISFSFILLTLQRLAAQQGGVFSYSDLFHLIGADSELKNKRIIQKLTREKMLFKVYRGFYVTPNPDLWILASRLKKNVCISMDSVLAKNGLIGTVPASVSAVCLGARKETVTTPFGDVRFFSIQKDLFFGFAETSRVLETDNEKAFLDLLYYRAKGAKFAIDPLQEVDLGKFDLAKLARYLKRYKNPKFVSFVKGIYESRD